jgi:hypothetical protein
VSGDLHTPTNAGPEPDASFGTSAGPAGVDATADDKPELIVGAAFAGGLLLATILKRLRS